MVACGRPLGGTKHSVAEVQSRSTPWEGSRFSLVSETLDAERSWNVAGRSHWSGRRAGN